MRNGAIVVKVAVNIVRMGMILRRVILLRKINNVLISQCASAAAECQCANACPDPSGCHCANHLYLVLSESFLFRGYHFILLYKSCAQR